MARGRAAAVQAVAEEDVDEQAVRMDLGRVPVRPKGADGGPLEQVVVCLYTKTVRLQVYEATSPG